MPLSCSWITGNEDGENDQYFDAEQMFQQLNYECTLDEGGSSSESGDENMVKLN